MPKSKGRKPKNTKRRRQPPQVQSGRRPLGVIEDWNRAVAHLDTDQFYTEWCRLQLIDSNHHQRALMAAMMMWVGAGDPGNSPIGLYQCWHACYLIGEGMKALGYSAELVTVAVEVITSDGQVIDRIGSPSPRNDGNYWTGHIVLLIPEMTTIFDPTIGQGKFATTPHLRAPVLLTDPQLYRRPAAASRFVIRRDPDTILVYTVITGGERPEDNPGHFVQKQHIDDRFSQMRPTFIERANAIQGCR